MMKTERFLERLSGAMPNASRRKTGWPLRWILVVFTSVMAGCSIPSTVRQAAAPTSKPVDGYRVVMWANTPYKPFLAYYGMLVIRIYNVSAKRLPVRDYYGHFNGLFTLRIPDDRARPSRVLNNPASRFGRYRNMTKTWIKPGQFVQYVVWIGNLTCFSYMGHGVWATHMTTLWLKRLLRRKDYKVTITALPSGLGATANSDVNVRSNALALDLSRLAATPGTVNLSPLSWKEWRKGRAMWAAEKRARARALTAVKAQLGKGAAGAAAGKFGIQSGAERSSYGPMLNPGGGPISRIRLPAGWRVSRVKVFRSAHGAFLLEAYRRKRDFTIMYDPDNARFRAREEQAAKHPKKGKDIIAGAGKNWEVHRTTYGFWAISRVAPIAVLGIPRQVVYTNPWRLRFIREALRSVVMAHKPASHAAGRTVPPPPR